MCWCVGIFLRPVANFARIICSPAPEGSIALTSTHCSAGRELDHISAQGSNPYRIPAVHRRAVPHRAEPILSPAPNRSVGFPCTGGTDSGDYLGYPGAQRRDRRRYGRIGRRAISELPGHVSTPAPSVLLKVDRAGMIETGAHEGPSALRDVAAHADGARARSRGSAPPSVVAARCRAARFAFRRAGARARRREETIGFRTRKESPLQRAPTSHVHGVA